MTIGEKVIFIIKQHQRIGQLYGDLPYHVHLNDVANFAKKYKYLIPEDDYNDVYIAAWGHDIIEDAGLTYNDVKKVLGERVANIIYAVSNEKGRNRKERANDKYYEGIKVDNYAIFVKLCDRLANITFSKLHGHTNMYVTYKKEAEHFKEKLYNGKYDEMWKELDNIEFTEKDTEYYPKIDIFNEDNIWYIHLPKPIPGDLYIELYKKGIIPKKNLLKNHYYFGKCRNGRVAMWNGYEFIYMRQEMNKSYHPEEINHIEDDNGFDLFIPLKEVTPEEHQRIKY
jgi:hypothetical protein